MVKQLLSHISSGWPPSPHDPRKRIWVGQIGEWEIRTFSRTHPQYEYFARQGFLHLQIWHPWSENFCLNPITAHGLPLRSVSGPRWNIVNVSFIDGERPSCPITSCSFC